MTFLTASARYRIRVHLPHLPRPENFWSIPPEWLTTAAPNTRGVPDRAEGRFGFAELCREYRAGDASAARWLILKIPGDPAYNPQNPKVVGSNPTPATTHTNALFKITFIMLCIARARATTRVN